MESVVGLCVSFSLLVMFVSPAKTTEMIQMPFGGLSQVSPSNHTHHQDLYLAARNRRNGFITICCDTEYLPCTCHFIARVC